VATPGSAAAGFFQGAEGFRDACCTPTCSETKFSVASTDVARSELDSMQSGISCLSKSVSEMRSEMECLRQSNAQLSAQNRLLQSRARSQEIAREWDAIDVVEQHYRDLEKHKAHCRSRSPPRRLHLPDADGDCEEDLCMASSASRPSVAASTSVVKLSSWLTSGR
jgi:hypothetical protein